MIFSAGLPESDGLPLISKSAHQQWHMVQLQEPELNGG